MMQILKVLRILDPDGTVSLTSIVLIVAVVRFALVPLQTETLVALMGALAAHQGKKVIGNKAVSSKSADEVASLSAQVQTLNGKMTIMEARTAPRR